MDGKILSLALCAVLSTHIAVADVVDDLLSGYQAAGAKDFTASQGEALWHKTYPDPKEAGNTRSCTTCHGEDLRANGKHARTGKLIKPLAPSVNKERLTDAKFIEKWFKRNCKWVLGRECTPQEKGDLLSYLRKQ
jgi:type II secretory pathway component PulL